MENINLGKTIRSEDNLYYNGAMYCPEGKLLCRVSKKRLMWYVTRNLAEIIKEDPLEIKLKFKPAGTGRSEEKNIVTPLDNLCVVCGRTDALTKHHIVPKSFRCYFPLELKSNFSHDVVLLCVPCHETYERFSQELRRELRERYQASDNFINRDIERSKAIANANSLVRYSHKIPNERKEILRASIAKYINVDDLEALEAFSRLHEIDICIRTADKKIVMAQTNLDDFMIMWRTHFIEKMRPQFMPKNWNLNLRIS